MLLAATLRVGRRRCTPSTGAELEVEVLRGLGHRDSREPQGRDREGTSEGSGERTDGPTNRNRIRGGADQGERATDREALVTKGRQRKSGGRDGQRSYLGRPRLVPERATWPRATERGVSRGRSGRGKSDEGPNDGQAARTRDTDGPCARRPSNRWSSHWTIGVKPRGASAAAKLRRRHAETAAQEATTG